MSEIQILLVIVVVVLTMLLVIVGVQVLLVLFAIKRVIARIHSMLDGKEKLEDLVTRERILSVLHYVKSLIPLKK